MKFEVRLHVFRILQRMMELMAPLKDLEQGVTPFA